MTDDHPRTSPPSQEERRTARDQLLSNPEPTEVGALLEELHAGIRSAKSGALWRKVSERALQLAADTITRLAAEYATEKRLSWALTEKCVALTARAEAAESRVATLEAEAALRRDHHAAQLAKAEARVRELSQRIAAYEAPDGWRRLMARDAHRVTGDPTKGVTISAALTNSRSEDA